MSLSGLGLYIEILKALQFKHMEPDGSNISKLKISQRSINQAHEYDQPQWISHLDLIGDSMFVCWPFGESLKLTTLGG